MRNTELMIVIIVIDYYIPCIRMLVLQKPMHNQIHQGPVPRTRLVCANFVILIPILSLLFRLDSLQSDHERQPIY